MRNNELFQLLHTDAQFLARSKTDTLQSPKGVLSEARFLSGVSRRLGVLSFEATYQQLFAPKVSFIIEVTRDSIHGVESVAPLNLMSEAFTVAEDCQVNTILLPTFDGGAT